ncbi:MAG: glutathione S-transferase family protein [Cyanobacteria bacterium P01_A01_bin.70]
MLKFYYHPLSPIARRVWLALLEKAIAFEPVLVDLKNRENLKPDYLALNPFHHVPVMVDGDLQILESFAILDYLEAKFPTPALSPTNPAAIARMKMVQLVIANELMPQLPGLVFSNADSAQSKADPTIPPKLDTVLTFLTARLGTDDYFGGDRLSLADVTAGAALPLMTRLGVNLPAYPSLGAWCDRLTQRTAWQQTDPDAASLAAWQRWITLMVKRQQRQIAKA